MWCWPQLMTMLKTLSERFPSLRVSLGRSTGPESWLRRTPTACLMRHPMPSIGERCLRGSDGSNLTSSPFYRPRAPNCILPLSVSHV
jgi:hypothetical protein